MLPSHWQARVVSFWLAYIAIVLLHPISSWGAKSLTVNWSNAWADEFFVDSSGNGLSQGDPAINQDGAAVQLGYFTQATSESLFAGDWVPLTWSTTIGDSTDLTGFDDGFFIFTTFFKQDSQFVQVYDDGDSGNYFTESSHPITTALPWEGAYLAIRFFNGPIGAATHYNTIASTAWRWTELSELNFQTLSLFVDEVAGTAQFEDADSPYSTTIALHSWDYGKSTQGVWTYLPWFGYYLETDTSQWIYHVNHGWLYRTGSRPGDLWFYDNSGLGWIWTNADNYPFFYSYSELDWIWFNGASADREFYHFDSGLWRTHSLSL